MACRRGRQACPPWHVAVRHARRLVRARLAAAPRPSRLTAHTPGRVPPFRIFHFHFRPNQISTRRAKTESGQSEVPGLSEAGSGRRPGGFVLIIYREHIALAW